MHKHDRHSWTRRFESIACFSAVLIFLFSQGVFACDVAVVSGRVTTNGRPLIWKSRDCSENWHQQIKYFTAENASPAGGYLLVYNYDDYAYYNNGTYDNPSGGVNEAGIAIACTSVYEDYNPIHEAVNVNTDLIRQTVQECVTLSDFETLLKTWCDEHVGLVISGNFVVIDAHGGAALYEIYTGLFGGDMQYRRYDADTGEVVTEDGVIEVAGRSDYCGYVNRANNNEYSSIESEELGLDITMNYGEERMKRADVILRDLAAQGKINYYTVMRNVAKDTIGLQNETYGSEPSTAEHYSSTYCISRAATRLALVVDGVKSGDNPHQTVFWCALGEPSAAVSIPFFAHAQGVSDLLWVDSIGLDGTRYDLNDTCILNRAFNAREIYDRLIYKSNTGTAYSGMDNKFMNKTELAKVQAWSFLLEDTVVDMTEEFMGYLRNDATLLTPANLRAFSEYCTQYVYDNYLQGANDAVAWSYTMPTGTSVGAGTVASLAADLTLLTTDLEL